MLYGSGQRGRQLWMLAGAVERLLLRARRRRHLRESTDGAAGPAAAQGARRARGRGRGRCERELEVGGTGAASCHAGGAAARHSGLYAVRRVASASPGPIRRTLCKSQRIRHANGSISFRTRSALEGLSRAEWSQERCGSHAWLLRIPSASDPRPRPLALRRHPQEHMPALLGGSGESCRRAYGQPPDAHSTRTRHALHHTHCAAVRHSPPACACAT